jgi:FHS family L-fucose permease-like MFS transporter
MSLMKFKTIPVFLVFFIMGFGDAVGTLVGFVTKEFNLSPAVAGLLPFFGFLAFGLFSVPFGVLADKKGQKFVLVLFLALVLIGELVPVVSIARYEYVLLAIFFIGVGITALQVVGNPMMRTVSPEGKFSRNLTFAQFVKSVGSNAAPYILPLVVALDIGWQNIFLMFALVVAATLLSVLFMKVEEPKHNAENQRASIGSSFALLKDPYVLTMVLGIFLYVGAEVGLNSWIAQHLHTKFGLDLQREATLGIGVFMTSLAIGRLLGSIVLNFLSPQKFFLASSLLGVVAIGTFFIPVQIVVLAGIALAGLSFSNIFPLIFSILIDSRPERTNELSGLMVMAIVGGAIMPALMGVLANQSLDLSFAVPLAIFIYITYLAFRALKRPTPGIEAA